MPVPEWLFGPSGDLRPLPSPDGDVVNTVDRFGGVHNAVNGSRTVDTLGFKSTYQFELPYLDQEEYYRLEYLFTQATDEVLYLVDPLRKNLLSREAASGQPSDSSLRGLSPIGGSVNWPLDPSSPASWSRRVGVWSGMGAEDVVRFDRTRPAPVDNAEPVTFSVYLKASEDMDIELSLDVFHNGEQNGTVLHGPVTLPAGTWTRASGTFDLSSYFADSVAPVLWSRTTPVSSDATVRIAAAQLETGDSVTEASLGGGAAAVVIDALDVSSPRYPLQSVDLTLLEV